MKSLPFTALVIAHLLLGACGERSPEQGTGSPPVSAKVVSESMGSATGLKDAPIETPKAVGTANTSEGQGTSPCEGNSPAVEEAVPVRVADPCGKLIDAESLTVYDQLLLRVGDTVGGMQISQLQRVGGMQISQLQRVDGGIHDGMVIITLTGEKTVTGRYGISELDGENILYADSPTYLPFQIEYLGFPADESRIDFKQGGRATVIINRIQHIIWDCGGCDGHGPSAQIISVLDNKPNATPDPFGFK